MMVFQNVSRLTCAKVRSDLIRCLFPLLIKPPPSVSILYSTLLSQSSAPPPKKTEIYLIQRGVQPNNPPLPADPTSTCFLFFLAVLLALFPAGTSSLYI